MQIYCCPSHLKDPFAPYNLSHQQQQNTPLVEEDSTESRVCVFCADPAAAGRLSLRDRIGFFTTRNPFLLPVIGALFGAAIAAVTLQRLQACGWHVFSDNCDRSMQKDTLEEFILSIFAGLILGGLAGGSLSVMAKGLAFENSYFLAPTYRWLSV